MTLPIDPIHPNIGGRVSGISLSNPLTADQVAQLEAALDELTVLVFQGQELTDDQQKAFTLSFGAIENARGGNIGKREDRRLSDGLNDVSNSDIQAPRSSHSASRHAPGTRSVTLFPRPEVVPKPYGDL